MGSSKFFLAVLAFVGVLTCTLAAGPYEVWSELPQCAQTCINFAGASGIPPGDCSSRNLTCTCELGLWKSTCARCVREGDTALLQGGGCQEESDETIAAILIYVSGVFCPTANGTKEVDPAYSSWSFPAPTTTASSSTSTSSMLMQNATTTNSNMTTTVSSTAADGTPATGEITSYDSTFVSTVHASNTFVQSTTASPTSTSGAAIFIYHESTLAFLLFFGAGLAMFS